MAANGVSTADIWAALRQAGFSAIQAAGVMGNMLAESSFDVESTGSDPTSQCPKARAYGLINWNDCTYHDAAGLVTGNPQADLQAQVAYLVKTGGLAHAQGGTAAEVGSNFAHTYERCAACGYQGGSDQLTKRAANSDAVFKAASSGDWSSFSAENAVNQATQTTGATTGGGGSSGCAIKLPFGVCLLSNSQVKALKGGALVVAGGAVFIVGGLILVAYGFQRSGAARTASQALQATPVGRTASRAGRTTQSRTGAPSSRLDERSRLRRDISSGRVSFPEEADEPRVQRAARESARRNRQIAGRSRSSYERRVTRRTIEQRRQRREPVEEPF